MLVDVHCHLDMLSDLDSVIDNAKEAGVKAIITNGTNSESNRKALGISEKCDIVSPALGIYPNDCLKMSRKAFEEELNFIRENKPIAIGEIGLDYKEKVDKEEMKGCFEKQIELAKELDVPVIVHSRKAEADVIEILESFTYNKVVMHCFGGKKKFWQRIIDNKWHFSIPCIIVKLHHFQDIVEQTPLKKILTETDAPFMSPYQNVKQNEPAFIMESIQEIAKIKGQTRKEVANQIYMNYQKIFL